MVYGLCILSTDGGISPRLFCIYLFFASKWCIMTTYGC